MSLYNYASDQTKRYFSDSTLEIIQDKLRDKFNKYDGRIFIVHPDTIKGVMGSVYRNNINHPYNNPPYEMINEVIEIIYNDYVQEWEMNRIRGQLDLKKVNRWDPSLGIRQYPPLKLKKKRYTTGWFHMNY